MMTASPTATDHKIHDDLEAYGMFQQTSSAVAELVDQAVEAYYPEIDDLSADETILNIVLERVLWHSVKPNAKLWSNIEEVRPLLSAASRDYPPILDHITVDNSGEEPKFKSLPPRNIPDFLIPVVGTIFEGGSLPPALVSWRIMMVQLAKLIQQWRDQLGTDPILRKSIAEGRCHACL